MTGSPLLEAKAVELYGQEGGLSVAHPLEGPCQQNQKAGLRAKGPEPRGQGSPWAGGSTPSSTPEARREEAVLTGSLVQGSGIVAEILGKE